MNDIVIRNTNVAANEAVIVETEVIENTQTDETFSKGFNSTFEDFEKHFAETAAEIEASRREMEKRQATFKERWNRSVDAGFNPFGKM